MPARRYSPRRRGQARADRAGTQGARQEHGCNTGEGGVPARSMRRCRSREAGGRRVARPSAAGCAAHPLDARQKTRESGQGRPKRVSAVAGRRSWQCRSLGNRPREKRIVLASGVSAGVACGPGAAAVIGTAEDRRGCGPSGAADAGARAKPHGTRGKSGRPSPEAIGEAVTRPALRLVPAATPAGQPELPDEEARVRPLCPTDRDRALSPDPAADPEGERDPCAIVAGQARASLADRSADSGGSAPGGVRPCSATGVQDASRSLEAVERAHKAPGPRPARRPVAQCAQQDRAARCAHRTARKTDPLARRLARFRPFPRRARHVADRCSRPGLVPIASAAATPEACLRHDAVTPEACPFGMRRSPRQTSQRSAPRRMPLRGSAARRSSVPSRLAFDPFGTLRLGSS